MLTTDNEGFKCQILTSLDFTASSFVFFLSQGQRTSKRVSTESVTTPEQIKIEEKREQGKRNDTSAFNSLCKLGGSSVRIIEKRQIPGQGLAISVSRERKKEGMGDFLIVCGLECPLVGFDYFNPISSKSLYNFPHLNNARNQSFLVIAFVTV